MFVYDFWLPAHVIDLEVTAGTRTKSGFVSLEVNSSIVTITTTTIEVAKTLAQDTLKQCSPTELQFSCNACVFLGLVCLCCQATVFVVKKCDRDGRSISHLYA